MTAPSGLIVRTWRIDLPTAQRFLEKFKEPEPGVEGTNRKWSADVVNNYAFEMLAGRWGFSHQGFAFTGFLGKDTAEGKDGEQRCRALIQACTVGATKGPVTYPPDPYFTFDVMVTEGLDEEAWLAMDIGKRRTASDFLVSEGVTNGNVMASLIHLVFMYENEPVGQPFVRDRWIKSSMSPMQRKEYLKANPTLLEAIPHGARLGKRMTVSAAAAGYFLAVKAGHDPKKVEEFFDLLHSGAGMETDHPAFVLREMMINARNSVRTRYTRFEQLALFIKAFNKWTAGEPVKRQLAFKTKKSSMVRQGKYSEVSAEVFPRFIS